MNTLSSEQKQALVEIVIEEYGNDFDYEKFAELVMELFEDISGFESLTIRQKTRIINLLWRNYNEHKPIQKI